MKKITLLIPICLFLLAPLTHAEDLSYSDLVGRLTDAKRLATAPDPGVKSGCLSSCDRGARYDEETGKYVQWWANRDGNGFMDKEGTMFNVEGPGVIWRIWSARPQKGPLEFYFDGEEKPSYVVPFNDLFTKPPYSDYTAVAHVLGKGHNTYIPIPFQKSLRIRAQEGWGAYYQISYTQFPKGTKVPTFTGKFSDADKKALQKANDTWTKRGPKLFVSDDAKETTKTVTVKPGETVTLAEFNTSAAISGITLDRPEMTRDESLSILRELALQINWDGEKHPAVWAPLGDFFGTGGTENLYRTLMTGMTKEGYYTNWWMPFEKAKITLTNDGKQPRELTFHFYTEPVADANKLLRFHCKWQRDDFSGFEEKRFFEDRWPDWPVLKVDGSKGRFCGFHMHVWNPLHLWNKGLKHSHERVVPDKPLFAPGKPARLFYDHSVKQHYWWGEGDEKFFVDGEKMPSTFGTGTEDYFGFAWGTPSSFDSALQAQPRNGAADEIGKVAGREGPGNIGHIAMVRWQLQDDVPFQKSFEATIEKYHPNEWPLLNAMTAVWYQEPGKADYYGSRPLSDRDGYYVPARPLKIEPGLLEGERLKVREVTAGETKKQGMGGFRDGKWSGGSQLLWIKGEKGDSIELEFDVEAKGMYELVAVFTKAPDYGIFELELDGKKVGEQLDLYDAKVIPTKVISFGKLELTKGPHVLKATAVGKNEKNKKAPAGEYLFGLDYLKLKK